MVANMSWKNGISVVHGRPKRREDSLLVSRDPEPFDTPEYDDLFFPGPSRQCSVNGISLYEGAIWSPEPCSVCQCRRMTVSCRPIPCTSTVSPPQQLVDYKAKSPTPNRLEKEVKPGRGKGRHRHAGNTKHAGKVALGRKPKKEKTANTIKNVEAPLTVTKMQTPPLRKKQGVPPKAESPGRNPPLPKFPDANIGPKVAVKDNKKTPLLVKRRPFDDDDDEDDDDDYLHDDSDSDDNDDYGNVSVMQPNVLPMVLPKSGPTKRTPVLPTGRPVAPPTRRPVRTTVRPIIHPARRTVFMESLPAGCLLSDSLIACGSTGLTHMPIISDVGVSTLYLADNRISKIPQRALAGLPNLEWLDLSKNKLDDSSLGSHLFRNLTKLRRLNLHGNNLTKVPALPPSLVELKISDNRLLGLTPNSFMGLSSLLTLELEDNRFHDGNVSPLTFRPLKRLIYLRLNDNKFRAIPSGLPASVQELDLSDNHIEVIHAGLLNKTVNLRVLDLSHNRIREDRIAPRAWIHLLKLEALDLSHNKLVHVPSFLPVGLRQLTLHHNQIERIPGYVFGHMRPGLDSLQLSYNRLREDGINEVSFLGLYDSLGELLLDHNQLRTIPRGLLQLKALQQVRLNNNFISDVPLNAICDTTAAEDSPLMSVHLENNLIDRRLIPPTAFSCIKSYHSVLLRPQRYEDYE